MYEMRAEDMPHLMREEDRRPDESSPSVWWFDCTALSDRMERMGLEVERNAKGGPRRALCKICGDVAKSGTLAQCDPEKHRAYYASFPKGDI